MEKLIKMLSDLGLKETKDIAHHSDDLEQFILYMEFDISERKQALKIAKRLLKSEGNN